MILKIELRLLLRAKFSQKYGSFDGITSNLIFTYYHEGNFRKNKAVLLMWVENLNCTYYHELKFSRKQGSFVEAIRKFELHLLLRAEIFSKTRQFWYHLKIWTAPIITSWNFCKNISYLMKSFEYLNCPNYHEV